jgi:hypothetical protein
MNRSMKLGAALLAAASLLLPATGALAANHPVGSHIREMDDADIPGQADPAARPVRGHRLARHGKRLHRRGRRIAARGRRQVRRNRRMIRSR